MHCSSKAWHCCSTEVPLCPILFGKHGSPPYPQRRSDLAPGAITPKAFSILTVKAKPYSCAGGTPAGHSPNKGTIVWGRGIWLRPSRCIPSHPFGAESCNQKHLESSCHHFSIDSPNNDPLTATSSPALNSHIQPCMEPKHHATAVPSAQLMGRS